MPDGPALSLHPLLARRWSPTTFDPAEEVSEDAVEILLEAARWRTRGADADPAGLPAGSDDEP